jgi:hypothetical protein
MAEDKVSNTDALKALVEHVLNSGAVHPDQETKLRAWQDQNLTDDEKDNRLTDDEFVEKHGKTRAQAAADREAQPAPPPSASSIPGSDDTETDEPEADTGAKPKSGTRK